MRVYCGRGLGCRACCAIGWGECARRCLLVPLPDRCPSPGAEESDVAIENAVIYVLTELPALAVAKVLRRCFAWTPRPAETVAALMLMGVAFGACLLAWWLYEWK